MKYFSLIFTALILLWQNPAMALGLGTPSSNTLLGQPLHIEIPILGIGNLTDEDIKVAIAKQATYQKMGIDFEAFHSTLQFSIIRDEKGATLAIDSPKNINEPYAHFLVEIISPTGSVIKEVSVLLDAPQ